MGIKKLLKSHFTLLACTAFTVAFTACGDDSSSSAESDDSSSSVASFRSSSSLSTRADIDYKDTVRLGDTMKVYIDLFNGDSSKMDSSEHYIDSAATSFPMYLGELPKGSRIKVYATTSNIAEDRIRIKSEFGEYLKALTAVPKNSLSKDSIYDNYLAPSLGKDTSATFKDSNQFVVFNGEHYFLELSGDFNNESSLRLKVLVDTAYYEYTGDEDNISMKMTDTLRGIMEIDNAPDEVSIAFSANEGFAVNLTTTGKNIVSYKLTDGDSLLGESNINIDTMLVPNDSVDWNIKVSAESFSNFMTGPFAFFEAITKARALEQGEYFSKPDSIPYPGEAFLRTRPKDNMGVYKYNLRQEQFVWIGDYKKGDSVMVNHEILNYSTDPSSTAKCEILDKDQKVQVTITCSQGGSFAIKGEMTEGPYYLHYLRLNSYPLDQGLKHDSLRYVLQLSTMVQQPGLLKDLNFYDPEHDKNFSEKTISVGDTLRFSDFEFTMTPNSNQWKIIGSDISWFIPCASLDYVKLSGGSSTNCKGEEDVSSRNNLVATTITDGNKIELIAQSVADPAMRDTLKISIIAKAE